VVAAVLKSVQEEGRAAGLKGFEQVAAVALAPEPFSVENNMMTPTFKLKRPQALAAFQDKIAAMYAQLPGA
jgi:long-chain acyl-CoA synthetase